MNAALAAAATLVASAFALSTLDRWLRRRRPHDLAWTVSLALFALGAGALWWAESVGWNLGAFRVFYLAGAILNVPWLALGTVYLLAERRLADRVRTWLILLSGFAVGVVLFAPTHGGISGDELPTGKDVFAVAPRVLAAVGSGIAALIIVAGAVWSVWHPRRATGARLVSGNVLIATGTLILSASGTLAGRLGKDRAFAITLLVGICVLFAGFLVATGSATRRPRLDQATPQQLAADVAR
ncbi:hypothetical protein BH10ACT2_BH10ACT2_13350 [soil metagenome]